ncbi:MAG TPA: LLM class flavin-dependent oxidoreductase [Steroidobacteraceae bacterium]|nr:LLM class flavin-dependent oxidoreductase [Steroidobacteraceae bacterium]
MHVGIASGFANHSKVDDRQFIREELMQLELAAELGFESIWITEHHFSDYSVSPNPLMYLAYLAGRHPRVRLGTQVIVVPWHDPVRLCEEIVLLDHVSGGRALLGFGRGLSRMEYEGLRVDQAQARERFDETVKMIMGALESGVVEGGELFKQPRREIRPRPMRTLKGRAFCAAGSPASMVSAAKLGLGRLYLGQPMIAGHAESKSPIGRVTGDEASDAWLEAWHEAHPGEQPVAPFVSNLVFVDESGDRARELARIYTGKTFAAAVKNYEMTSEHHGTIKGYEAYSRLRMTPEQAEEAIRNAHRNSIAGTPREVLEQLEEVKRLRQPQGMFPHLYTGGMPHEECIRSIHLFASKCLNEMKSWTAAPTTIDG